MAQEGFHYFFIPYLNFFSLKTKCVFPLSLFAVVHTSVAMGNGLFPLAMGRSLLSSCFWQQLCPPKNVWWFFRRRLPLTVPPPPPLLPPCRMTSPRFIEFVCKHDEVLKCFVTRWVDTGPLFVWYPPILCSSAFWFSLSLSLSPSHCLSLSLCLLSLSRSPSVTLQSSLIFVFFYVYLAVWHALLPIDHAHTHTHAHAHAHTRFVSCVISSIASLFFLSLCPTIHPSPSPPPSIHLVLSAIQRSSLTTSTSCWSVLSWCPVSCSSSKARWAVQNESGIIWGLSGHTSVSPSSLGQTGPVSDTSHCLNSSVIRFVIMPSSDPMLVARQWFVQESPDKFLKLTSATWSHFWLLQGRGRLETGWRQAGGRVLTLTNTRSWMLAMHRLNHKQNTNFMTCISNSHKRIMNGITGLFCN